LAALQVDRSICWLYNAAFKALYYSCKKNKKVRPGLLLLLQLGLPGFPSASGLILSLPWAFDKYVLKSVEAQHHDSSKSQGSDRIKLETVLQHVS